MVDEFDGPKFTGGAEVVVMGIGTHEVMQVYPSDLESLVDTARHESDSLTIGSSLAMTCLTTVLGWMSSGLTRTSWQSPYFFCFSLVTGVAAFGYLFRWAMRDRGATRRKLDEIRNRATLKMQYPVA